MSIEDFKNSINNLNKKLDAYYSGFAEESFDKTVDGKKHTIPYKRYIRDGLVNVNQYFFSKIKILWILKEPRDLPGNRGGGWSIVDNINEKRSERIDHYDPHPTFDPIIQISYGILNGFISIEQMPILKNNPQMCKILKSIGYMNVQKMPAGSLSNDRDIASAYIRDKLMLFQQINTFDPNIIIFGTGTRTNNLISKDMNLINNYTNKHLHFVYHPSYHKSQAERNSYVNRIIDKAKACHFKS